MTLLPVLPILDGESLTSYVTRIARFHFGSDPFGFLDFIELSRQKVMEPDDAVMTRLSELSGQTVARLWRSTHRSVDTRILEHRGERFNAEFFNRHQTSFCPACLLEDRSTYGQRVGRVDWRFESIRTCPHHGVPLVRRKNTSHGERFQYMDMVAPEDDTLERMLEGVVQRAPSPLQTYVQNRLNGQIGPDWLDGQDIDTAARACEMIGVVMVNGPKPNLQRLTEGDWDAAGAAGYRAAADGEAGIRAALADMKREFASSGRVGGPQAVFGRLYQWIQFSKTRRPVGPIRELLRDVILDNFSLEPGTELFGVPVAQRRKHTVSSLSRTGGIHPKTLTRALMCTGLVDAENAVPPSSQVFDAPAGDRLVQRIHDSLSLQDLPRHLNCNRTQAEMLVRTGFIPRLTRDAPGVTGVLKNVAREDADLFLKTLFERAIGVVRPGVGMVDMIEASEQSRVPVIDIVRAILSGSVTKVECADPAAKFKGVLVDPTELRSVLLPTELDARLDLKATAAALGMTTSGVHALTRLHDRDGHPILSKEAVTNAKGVSHPYFRREEVKAFRDEHVSLKDVAAAASVGSKQMKQTLDAAGIMPIGSRRGLGRFYYRRSDLKGVPGA
jgi:hypothetical protein